MKKLTLLLVALIAISTKSNAQFSAVSYDSDKWEKLKSTKTLIVLSKDDDYNDRLMDVLKEEWTLTEYDFIELSEFKKNLSNPEYSFLVYIEITPNPTIPKQVYHYLALFNGGKKRLNNYSYNDMLLYAMHDYWQNEKKYTQSSYRLPLIISSMMKTAEIIKNQKIKGNSLKITEKLVSVFNKSIKTLKEKTLLINEKYIYKKLKEADIKKYYSYPFEIVSEERIEEAIDNKEPEYCIMIKTSTLNKFVSIYDAETREIVYGELDVMGLTLHKKDIKELSSELK